jgi:hypothetical protein
LQCRFRTFNAVSGHFERVPTVSDSSKISGNGIVCPETALNVMVYTIGDERSFNGNVIMEAEGEFGYFAVPEGFKFPTRPKLQEALRFWLLGQVLSEDSQRKVRPFQKNTTEGSARESEN